MSSPFILVVDPLVAASIMTELEKQTARTTTADYVQVNLSSVVGKVMSCAEQLEDGTINASQILESGKYRIESEHGLFLAVQHNSCFVKIFWVKWAYFVYDAEYFSLSEFRIIALHNMAKFLIEYVDRSVLWPIGIDPMLKHLAAITSHSYESQLAFFLPKGVKLNEVHSGIKHAFAKSLCGGSLSRQALYVYMMIVLGHTCMFTDVVYENGAFQRFRTWLEMIFPREGENTVWIRQSVDFQMGVHDLLDAADDPDPKQRFVLPYDTVHCAANAAQDLLIQSGAPCVNLIIVLDSYFRYVNGQPLEYFTPLDLKKKAPELEDLEGQMTLSPPYAIAYSPRPTARKRLLAEFNEARFDVTPEEESQRSRFDTLVATLEAEE